MTAQTQDGKSSFASKIINTVLPPINVEGALGPNRAASLQSNLYLTANPSDPLEEMVKWWQVNGTSMEPWIYKWSCQRRCWAGQADCDPAVEGEPCGEMGLREQHAETAVILAGAMEEGYRYLFQALVSREPFFDGNGELQSGRVRIASVIIDAVDSRGSPVLNVAIRGKAAGSSINAHEALILECLSAPAAGAILWELKQGDLPVGYRLSDVAVSNGDFPAAGQRRLVLPPDTFTPGQEIELGCSAVSLDGRSSGHARMPLYVRPVPSGGTISLSAMAESGQPWQPLDATKPFEMAQAGTSLADSNRDGVSDTFVGDFEELRTVVKLVATGWTYPGREVLGNGMQPKFQYQFFYRLGGGTRVPLTSNQVSQQPAPDQAPHLPELIFEGYIMPLIWHPRILHAVLEDDAKRCLTIHLDVSCRRQALRRWFSLLVSCRWSSTSLGPAAPKPPTSTRCRFSSTSSSLHLRGTSCRKQRGQSFRVSLLPKGTCTGGSSGNRRSTTCCSSSASGQQKAACRHVAQALQSLLQLSYTDLPQSYLTYAACDLLQGMHNAKAPRGKCSGFGSYATVTKVFSLSSH